ncbi:MAG: hypothetical protein QME42_05520 [bacterium]|nr:hypothetical protein [bacterium]
MEILGLSLTALGLLFTYIWKANGKLQKTMMQALERIEEGQKEIVKMTQEGFKTAQESSFTLSQMLINQTKILEKIESRTILST